MADKLRLYVICPCCGGKGEVPWGESPTEPGMKPCPMCCDGNELDVKEFDGLLHVYYGRFEEVVEE